jgi:hypothetical protein
MNSDGQTLVDGRGRTDEIRRMDVDKTTINETKRNETDYNYDDATK